MPRFHHVLLPVSVLGLAGCVGGFANPGGGGSVDDFLDDIPADQLVCPADPDCAIGGDCSLYECPDHWICETYDDGTERCVSPGPDYPDRGSWDCHDQNGQTICEGGSYPDGGGGDGWNCMQSGDLVTCTSDHPDYPDGGGGSGWSCWYEGDLRVCSTVPGDSGDGGGWTCWEDETGRHCRRDRPDLPGDGGDWTCFDYEDETHCDGGPGIPDGGGWECEDRGGEYYCTTTPDYPDGGGGGHWSCRFTREFRVCDWHDDGGGDGGIPRTDCAPTDPTCGSTMCTDEMRGGITLIDDLDGEDNGEIYVLGDGRRDESCATVRVDVTAYYALYDAALAESCTRQLDEISYVTIENTCNADGNPVERNVGDRFVIGDVDNTPDCTTDAECGAGSTCRGRSSGNCCVPTAPAFVGTFLLMAGEDNRICLHHVCPEVRAGSLSGADAFMSAGCEGSINSVHLRLDGSAFTCPDPSLEFPMGCGM
ncbi:MAG: hypothetical protein KC619_34470 [Myxococcales bacterium]|nr:hypothetical protein [Myxococcales bacterium]